MPYTVERRQWKNFGKPWRAMELKALQRLVGRLKYPDYYALSAVFHRSPNSIKLKISMLRSMELLNSPGDYTLHDIRRGLDGGK